MDPEEGDLEDDLNSELCQKGMVLVVFLNDVWLAILYWIETV